MIRSIIAIIAIMFFIDSMHFGHATETKTELAYFAGGCFWCTESDFEKLKGVTEVVSGYMGGAKKNPNYKEVSAGGTGHLEIVKVIYDPNTVTYKDLLNHFWKNVDPTDKDGQFVDRGEQYAPAIFYVNDDQKKLAVESKKKLSQDKIFNKPIVAVIRPALAFYQAEDYHQNFYRKSKLRYKYYRYNSGRNQFIEKTWKGRESYHVFNSFNKPDVATLKKQLTAIQFNVTQENGTEMPFKNEYWDNKEAGIYVDVVSAEPLFSSIDKFKSGTGWPSFTRLLADENVVRKTDRKWGMKRTEVRSKQGGSHLGHVFNDGPKPTGLRYCINSASLRFIPVSKLKEKGYAQYLDLFKTKNVSGGKK